MADRKPVYGAGRAIVSAAEAKTAAGVVTSKSTEAKQVVAANSERVGIYLDNIGEKDAYIALGSGAESEKGGYLKAGTGSKFIQGYTGEITVRAKEGEPKITYMEI